MSARDFTEFGKVLAPEALNWIDWGDDVLFQNFKPEFRQLPWREVGMTDAMSGSLPKNTDSRFKL